jgi:cardiolipin synthase
MIAYYLSNPMAVRPLWVSKANTVAQILLIAFVLADRSGVAVLQPFLTVLVLGVAALTISSAGAYLVEWVRHMAGGPSDLSGSAS